MNGLPARSREWRIGSPARAGEAGGRRPARRGTPLLLLLLALAGCAAERPMTRAGEALDRTGTRVGDAVGRAAQNTGAAVSRAGDRLRDRSPPLPPPGLHNDSPRTP